MNDDGAITVLHVATDNRRDAVTSLNTAWDNYDEYSKSINNDDDGGGVGGGGGGSGGGGVGDGGGVGCFVNTLSN